MKSSLLTLLLFISYLSGFGQSSDCVELLKVILPGGVYEYENKNINEDMYHSILSYYKMHSSDTYQQSKQNSGSLTVPIDDVLVGLSLSTDERGYSQFIKDIETYYQEYSKYHLSLQTSWKHIKVEAIEAINGCLGSTPGIRAIKILTNDPNQMIIRFFYNDNYHGSPDRASLGIQSKTANIDIASDVVNKIKIRNRDHNDVLVSRKDNKSATIIFSSDARTQPNSSLSFSFPANSVPAKPAMRLSLSNGTITTNAETEGDYGPSQQATNAEYNFHHSPQPIPTPADLGPEYGTAALGTVSFAKTLALVKRDSTAEQYTLKLTLVNRCGARCGPGVPGHAYGASGHVTPVYNNTIKLPDLNSNQSFWNLVIRAGTIADDGGTGVGDSATLTITGKAKTYTLRFAIENKDNPKILKISLKPGLYDLEMKLPKMGRGCRGLPDGNRVQTSFITSMSLEIQKHEIIEPAAKEDAKDEKKTWPAFVIGAVVLLALIGIFIFLQNKKKSRS